MLSDSVVRDSGSPRMGPRVARRRGAAVSDGLSSDVFVDHGTVVLFYRGSSASLLVMSLFVGHSALTVQLPVRERPWPAVTVAVKDDSVGSVKEPVNGCCSE